MGGRTLLWQIGMGLPDFVEELLGIAFLSGGAALEVLEVAQGGQRVGLIRAHNSLSK